MHINTPMCGGASFESIAMKYVTVIDLSYVINIAKFGVDRLQGWGLMASIQILEFWLHMRIVIRNTPLQYIIHIGVIFRHNVAASFLNRLQWNCT